MGGSKREEKEAEGIWLIWLIRYNQTNGCEFLCY